MRITDITEAVSDSLLYHAVKIEYAVKQLDNDRIEGRSHQRVWPDGVRRKEDDEHYEDHWLLKGISTTRDFSYATGWGGVIYILDRDRLAHNYKIVPYNWGFHIGGGYQQKDIKREREEFVVFNVLKKSFDDLTREWEKYNKQRNEKPDEFEFISQHDYMTMPSGELKPLSRYLRGVMLADYMIEIYGEDDPMIKAILSHPKYKGIYKE